ncbi:hypothetical protein BJ138DRAFT_1159825 [Hygrophoropsis aurantiaca]|uniref:Uncharacterized protein n=1 Tax=Hygrophoropsis aurantiaca TaxID=72124 RepID=A0ACB8A311_9AGAM|nr:hypothetical protein BJ138DRAFT_1159825 [Hygrophoropsis aurantiaca]
MMAMIKIYLVIVLLRYGGWVGPSLFPSVFSRQRFCLPQHRHRRESGNISDDIIDVLPMIDIDDRGIRSHDRAMLGNETPGLPTRCYVYTPNVSAV